MTLSNVISGFTSFIGESDGNGLGLISVSSLIIISSSAEGGSGIASGSRTSKDGVGITSPIVEGSISITGVIVFAFSSSESPSVSINFNLIKLPPCVLTLSRSSLDGMAPREGFM